MSYLRPYGTPEQQAADRNARGVYGWRELKALERANAEAVARAMTETAEYGRARRERAESQRERLKIEITDFLGLHTKSVEELERLRDHLKLVLGDQNGHMLKF